MRSISKSKGISRIGWVVLGLLVAVSASRQAYKLGREKGSADLLRMIRKPDLQILPINSQGDQLILVRQQMADDQIGNRVKIDVSSLEGVEATALSDSGRGRFGFYESITLWQISNTTGREVEITEAAFTNLPEGFRLKSDFFDDSVIRLKPRS